MPLLTKLKLLLIGASGVVSKNATAASAVTAGATAVTIGADPIPWAIGAAAASVVYAYKRPETRAHAVADAVICIFIGGLVAPYAGSIIQVYYGDVWANEYVLAGLMAASWPWVGPVLFGAAVKKLTGK